VRLGWRLFIPPGSMFAEETVATHMACGHLTLISCLLSNTMEVHSL
jgi:hypothetical protein